MLRKITRAFRPAGGVTVRWQFGMATGLLCVAMIGALAASTTILGGRTTEDLARNQMAKLAGTMLDNLQRGMFERFRELQLLAQLETTTDILSIEPGKVRDLLERIQTTFGAYAWLGMAQPDGTVGAATKNMLTGTSVAEHAWFQKGREGIALGDVGEVEALSELMRPGPDAAAPKFVSLSVPVRKNDGTLVGVLGAHIHWQWADDLRLGSLTAKDSATETEVQVLSQDGVVLLGPDIGSRPFSTRQFAEMKTAGSGTFIDQAGERAALTGYAVDKGYRDYPGLGWVVVAKQPADVAFRPVHALVWTLLGIGIGIAAAGIGLARILARRIAAPIWELTEAADRIGRDPGCTMFPILGGPNEVIRLSSVLRLLLCRVGFAEQRTFDAETRAEQEARRLNQNIDKLRQLAETDPLTGLLNRRTLLGLAERAVVDHDRQVGILMFDIDHFKSINDRHGHAAGDAVIRAVADTIASTVRGTDQAAQFGGEEFIVLIYASDLRSLVTRGERIRSTIEAMPVIYSETRIEVTVSCGAAVLAHSDRDIQSLIERADAALYTAKNRGRNQVWPALDNRPSSGAQAA